jgi:hypothetical protein
LYFKASSGSETLASKAKTFSLSASFHLFKLVTRRLNGKEELLVLACAFVRARERVRVREFWCVEMKESAY